MDLFIQKGGVGWRCDAAFYHTFCRFNPTRFFPNETKLRSDYLPDSAKRPILLWREKKSVSAIIPMIGGSSYIPLPTSSRQIQSNPVQSLSYNKTSPTNRIVFTAPFSSSIPSKSKTEPTKTLRAHRLQKTKSRRLNCLLG